MTNRDILDRAAQELSGGEFRLRRDDPDAGNKFLAFVGQQEDGAKQLRELSLQLEAQGVNPPSQLPIGSSLEDRIKEKKAQLAASQKLVGPVGNRIAFSDIQAQNTESLERGLMSTITPLIPETFVESAPGPLQIPAAALRNLSSPAALLALPLGAAVAPIVGGAGAAGFGTALAAEAALAGGGSVAGASAEALGAPLPVQIAADLAGAVTVAGAIKAGPRIAGAASRQAGRAAGGVARAADRIPGSPVGVARAAGPEDAGRVAGDLPEGVPGSVAGDIVPGDSQPLNPEAAAAFESASARDRQIFNKTPFEREQIARNQSLDKQLADFKAAEDAVSSADVASTYQKAATGADDVPHEIARRADIDIAAPDGGRVKPKATPPPSDALRAALMSRRQGTGLRSGSKERIDQALLRRYEAGINVETRAAEDMVRSGNKLLKEINWGKSIRGTRATLNAADITTSNRMFSVLHGESPASALSAAERKVVASAREEMDFVTAMRLDFDPDMAIIDDYFYRGWKPPEGAKTNAQGQLIFTPAFKKPRNGSTFAEMLEAGWEPLFHNPFEQIRVARMQTVRYQAQMELVEALKEMGDDVIQPNVGGVIPDGWRVPKVGPAFEGKPLLIKDDLTGELVPGAVRRYAVPDNIANSLENAFGKKPDLGSISIGKRDFNILKVIDWLVFTPKRAKLLGTFFQQQDFATRLGIGTAANFVDLTLRGRPDLAIRQGFKYPFHVMDMLRANFSPRRREQLRALLRSDESVVPGRPNVTYSSVMGEGLSIRDSTIFSADIDKVAREAASSAGVLKLRSVKNGLLAVEQASRNGLFEGFYPAVITADLKNITGPMYGRLYKNLSDEQLSARIASALNTKYSTLPETASVVQNRFLREFLRRFFFSLNEQEGLLRQAAGPFRGADKAYWARHWIGAAIFLIGTANLIHFATTGEPLPKERWLPFSKLRYNTRFASPNAPDAAALGRTGMPVTIDIVGQMDTAFRLIDPKSYIESRFSVPLRAGQNQWSGEDFWGGRIDTVGPGGVVSRTAALAIDLFGPIGVTPGAQRAIRENVPGAARTLTPGETRLSGTGLAAQGLGVNLRAANFNELEKLQQDEPERAEDIQRELTLRKIDSAIQNIGNETSFLATSSSLRARLREARALEYDTGVVVIEAELERRGELQTAR